MMKIAAKVVVLLLCLAWTSIGSANTVRYYPAWSCVGNNLPYSTSGLSFPALGGTFYCPAVTYVTAGQIISAIDVYYGTDSAMSLSCTGYGWDDIGNYYSSLTKYSCSTVGGCTTPSGTPNNGYNTIQFGLFLGGGTLLTASAISVPFYGVKCTATGDVDSGGPAVYGYATITTN